MRGLGIEGVRRIWLTLAMSVALCFGAAPALAQELPSEGGVLLSDEFATQQVDDADTEDEFAEASPEEDENTTEEFSEDTSDEDALVDVREEGTLVAVPTDEAEGVLDEADGEVVAE